MNKPAIDAANWYEKNGELLKQHFAKVTLRSDEADPASGGIAIELEGAHLTASIAIWNKGDIAIYVLKEGSEDPAMLADRVLSSNEDIPLLLDRHLEEILKMEKGDSLK